MNTPFSQNLRRLRQEKLLTQEQAAEKLGVSPQSVSRWECGSTYPDVMLLPEIARLYGVTVDDLYRENSQGYRNYAQRLLAVYEHSGKTEDFLAAEQEFSRLGPAATADDLRSWGVLYHYMTNRCAALALQKLTDAISAEGSSRVHYSAAQQRTALLCDLGRSDQAEEECSRLLTTAPGEPQSWLLCAAAHFFAEHYAACLEVTRKGLERFPDNAALHIYAGDACRSLKRYDEAFHHWGTARELDGTYLDADYSMAFCHEELGRYREAARVWENLHQELLRRGLTVEAEFPRTQADACRRKISDV